MELSDQQKDETLQILLQESAAKLVSSYLINAHVESPEDAGYALMQLMLICANALNANVGTAATMKVIQDVKRATSAFNNVGGTEILQ